MKTIWKYVLNLDTEQEIEVTEFAEPLFVSTQKGIPHIWFLADPKNNKAKKKIFIYGTGHEIPDDTFRAMQSGKYKKYIGTLKMYDDSLILHVFYEEYVV